MTKNMVKNTLSGFADRLFFIASHPRYIPLTEEVDSLRRKFIALSHYYYNKEWNAENRKVMAGIIEDWRKLDQEIFEEVNGS